VQHSSPRISLDVGDLVANTYKIEGLLGRGGMGSVFLASHQRLPGKRVAIKVLHADIASADVIARFRHEAEIASRLGHPNIVTVIDFNTLEDGAPYLVLEYLQGQDLAARIENGALPLAEALSIIRQVASALAVAHRSGVVHRDLKPQNIFLAASEIDGHTATIAKVLDFGISKMRGSSTVKTQDNAMLGTPQYMSPEQATGRQNDIDGRTDQFALGAILYEMLVGRPAFLGSSIPEVVFKVVYEEPASLEAAVPATPPFVVAAIAKAMRKSIDERFASVDDFVVALTGIALPSSSGSKSLPVAQRSQQNSVPSGMDATMASGDHGAASGTPASIATPVATPMISSQADKRSMELLQTGAAEVQVLPLPQPVQPTPALQSLPPSVAKPRKWLPWLAGVGTFTAAAVTALVLVRSQTTATESKPETMPASLTRSEPIATELPVQPTIAENTKPAPVEPPVQVQAKTVLLPKNDPPAKPATKPVPDKSAIAQKASTQPEHSVTTSATEKPDQEIEDNGPLAAAFGDFRDGKFDDARKKANKISDNEQNTPSVLTKARGLLLKIACVQNDGPKALNLSKRPIPPAMLKSARKICTKNGIDL
jgi:eukaryotic-like serine/threonine-protein kinase